MSELTKKYKFNYIILDDWRGYRFIYDTNEVRNCNNKCNECGLFKLLRNEKPDIFTARLKMSNLKDKSLFGNQNYLNCKTMKQYNNCYVNFINLKLNNRKDIINELKLIKNLKVIYSKNLNNKLIENNLKKSVINQVLKNADNCKKEIIIKCWKNLKDG